MYIRGQETKRCNILTVLKYLVPSIQAHTMPFKAENNISGPGQHIGKIPSTSMSSLSVPIPPASLTLHLLRPQALKTTLTAVPLTATATVLQAARAGTHRPRPAARGRHLPETSATHPAATLKTPPNNSRHPSSFIFFPPFPKIKLGVSRSGCTSCILRSLSPGPSLQDL